MWKTALRMRSRQCAAVHDTSSRVLKCARCLERCEHLASFYASRAEYSRRALAAPARPPSSHAVNLHMPPPDAAHPQLLALRLALLRERIERDYVHVRTLPAAASSSSDGAFHSFAVNGATCERWHGERVLVWHRGTDHFWALQEACPHAAISLEASDIEDLTTEYPGTSGPCISCPAHAYIFDLGSGVCLTNPRTADGRRYRVGALRSDAGDADVWLVRERRARAHAECPPLTPHALRTSLDLRSRLPPRTEHPRSLVSPCPRRARARTRPSACRRRTRSKGRWCAAR